MTGTNKTIAERLREAVKQHRHCDVDIIGNALGRVVICDDERFCGECKAEWFSALADAIEAEQADLRKQMDFERDTAMRERDCLCDRIEELEKSQLPEGIQWPRFEDGELVKFGDEYVNAQGNKSDVQRIQFTANGFKINRGQKRNVFQEYGEPVKRPEPEVLDADGVPIKVGDTVYGQSDSKEWQVVGFVYSSEHSVVATSGKSKRDLRPEWLTHRKPDTFESVVGEMLADFDGSDSIELDGYFDRLRKLLGGE